MYLAGGPRLKMRTYEPQDRAPRTLAASVPQTSIDYDAWSVIVATRTRTRRYGGNPIEAASPETAPVVDILGVPNTCPGWLCTAAPNQVRVRQSFTVSELLALLLRNTACCLTALDPFPHHPRFNLRNRSELWPGPDVAV